MNASMDPIHVLVIDDDLADQQLAKLALGKAERGKFVCDFADSLRAAAEKIRVSEYHVVLLDLGLPECAGMESIQRVRSLDEGLPIVVLSDLRDSEAAMTCLEYGAQDFINKSELALDTLVRAIRNAIHRQQLVEDLAFANDELARKNDDLARLCDTSQRFVDNVSHQFRGPLNKIREHLSSLLEGTGGVETRDPSQRQSLAVALEQCNDLTSLVEDLVDLSKLESGMLKSRRQNQSVDDLINRVRPALAAKASVQGVSLEFEIADDLPLIFGDSQQLGRVLNSLVLKAIHSCGEAGRVRIVAENGPDQQVQFSVFDNGSGVCDANSSTPSNSPPSGLSRPSQASPATHEFGLGIGIANELVELNLGTLTIRSLAGKGAVSVFTVPAADPASIACKFFRRHQERCSASGFIGLVEATCSAPDIHDEAVEAFLHLVARGEDLVFACANQRWLVATSLRCDRDCESLLVRAEQQRQEHNRICSKNPLPEIEFRVLSEGSVGDLPEMLEHLRSKSTDDVLHALATPQP